jgi:Zn-dependent peptidase ImmA (M78 family)
MSKTEVPITPEVLRWAIDESGYSLEELAAAAKLDSDDLKAWLRGDARPGVTAVRSLAQALRRQFAVFLLPRPPAGKHREVKFRHLPGASVRPLTPVERRYVRKAERLQRMLAWLAGEMQERHPGIPRGSVDDNPVETAAAFRATLGINDKVQRAWTSASMAFDAWREAVELKGVTVFLFQMGNESCRGFSLWDDRAPVIAVNTAWNDEARAFTLFHELGHLITRTNSACVAPPPSALHGNWDPAERWCEQFAAAVLIPADALETAIAERLPGAPKRVTDVASVKRLANWFHVSLRAVTLRLIEMGMARWDLYRELPAIGDAKRRGGPPGKGRDRQEIQEDQLGGRVIAIFRRAVERDVVTLSQALSYVDVPDTVLDPSNAGA